MDKGILKKATSDKSEPTAGHLYVEIEKMTFKDLKTANKLCEWLMSRLSGAKNTHQMVKCLKVIKHCSAKGHTDFQKFMQKQGDTLKEYASYRGKIDPIHRDQLNQQVRDAAKDAIQAIFSEQRISKLTNSLDGQGANTKDQSFGSSDLIKDHGSDGFKPVSNKLAEHMAQKQNSTPIGVMQGLRAAASKLVSGPTTIIRVDESGSGYEGRFGNDVVLAPVPENSSSASVATASSPGWGFKNELNGSMSPTVKDSDVLTEMQRFVEEYTSKKSAPKRTEISKFMKTLAQMEPDDGDDVAARLDEKLDQKMGWQCRLNALTLIEGLILAGNTEVIDYFKENPEDIQKNVSVIQTTVKEKAKKVLSQLKVPESSPARAAAAPVAAGAGYTVVNTDHALSFGQQPTQEVAPPVEVAPVGRKKKDTTKPKKRKKADLASAVPTPAPAQAQEPPTDMFRSMQVHGAQGPQQVPAAAQPQVGGFQFTSTPSPQPVAQSPEPVAQVASPGIGIPGLSPPTPQPQSQVVQQVAPPVVPASTGNALDDLFGAPPVNSQPVAASQTPKAASPGFDIFGLPTGDAVAPTPHATPLTATAGEFDFAQRSLAANNSKSDGLFDFASGSSSPAAGVPPTPVQSPATLLPQHQATTAAQPFGFQQEVAPPVAAVPVATVPTPAPAQPAAAGQSNELMAQLMAQNAALQAQILALQQQQPK
eukprot:TRINITY_DN1172_c0_g2_i1.p1 TRINITY_DN1172_c0_g2~~TRINITY_DN1172_c0_g2_i1.p1  ORF type:complete len:728 (+),score=161.60 TRINITY_DN1172_c0_g2_i1:72-2186(+)